MNRKKSVWNFRRESVQPNKICLSQTIKTKNKRSSSSSNDQREKRQICLLQPRIRFLYNSFFFCILLISLGAFFLLPMLFVFSSVHILLFLFSIHFISSRFVSLNCWCRVWNGETYRCTYARFLHRGSLFHYLFIFFLFSSFRFQFSRLIAYISIQQYTIVTLCTLFAQSDTIFNLNHYYKFERRKIININSGSPKICVLWWSLALHETHEIEYYSEYTIITHGLNVAHEMSFNM